MERYRGFAALLLAMALLSGCATPTAKIHYTLKEHPDSRPLQQVVLLPVDVNVKEMSAGGVEEEVPEWSRKAEENIRSALLIARGSEGGCCVTRMVDSSSLTPEERESLEEHLALFNTVAANAMWVDLPGNSAWHFKSEHFDYTLGDGLSFLKTRYGIDAGLIILGEDVVTTGGRKAMAILAAAGGSMSRWDTRYWSAGWWTSKPATCCGSTTRCPQAMRICVIRSPAWPSPAS